MAAAPAPEAVTLDELEEAGAMAVDEAAEELRESQEEKAAGDKAAEDKGGSSGGQALAAPVPEEARTPKTKKSPVGMTAAEWQVHRPTHLPYNPACRCCVAGRKRDDQHRRTTCSESEDMIAEGKTKQLC